IIFINMDKLVNQTLAGAKKNDGNFFIADKEGIIYPASPPEHLKKIALDSDSGYEITEINNEKHFLVYQKSNYFEWGYVNVIPFNQIFNDTNLIKSILVFVFILMFIIVMILG